ncbi:MAG: restriction endonuclease subunit S [Clostridia bacterium]|nr:restriction endonuclease subunit S [Clostridia bacterium]
MKIDVMNWKPFLIGKMFDIHPTKAYKNLSKEELNDGGTTPFVVNSAENNGIGGFSTLEATEQGGIITFSDTTDGNTFFYQPKSFIGFAHVQGMYPLERQWTKNELLFLVTVLTFVNLGRYNYGRKMTRENILNTTILLPADRDGKPDWIYMDNYIKSLHHENLSTCVKSGNSMDLQVSAWKEFYLHKLFHAGMGNGIDAVLTTNDNPKYNYVSRDSNGNGVVGFVDEMEGEEPFPAGAMSLALGGSFLGSCFIQKKPFYTAQNVAVLQEKVPLSDYTKLFIATLIRNECKIKYQAFGRELNAHFRKDFTIKLPIKRDANSIIYDEMHEFSDDGYIPDWEWMENYIKSLPYSDRI